MSIHYGKSYNCYINFLAKIEVADKTLTAQVNIPTPPKGLIIFPKVSSGGGSNMTLFNTLLKNRYGIITANLLSAHEQTIQSLSNNLTLLTERLIEITKWVNRVFVQDDIKLAYFGDCQAGIAAIKASTYFENNIKAIVCKDGKTDSVKKELKNVHSPTLLMVDRTEKQIVSMNRNAFKNIMSVDKLLVIKKNQFEHLQEFSEAEVKESIDWLDKYISTEQLAIA